jgi:hypothetical protein
MASKATAGLLLRAGVWHMNNADSRTKAGTVRYRICVFCDEGRNSSPE